MTEVTIDPTEKLISRELREQIAEKAVRDANPQISLRVDRATLMSTALAAIDVYQSRSRLTDKDYNRVLPEVLELHAEMAIKEYLDVWEKMVETVAESLSYEQVRDVVLWIHSLDKTESGNPWYVIAFD